MNILSKISSIFSYTTNPIDYKKELMGGFANFMAISYIIAVNPLILNANGQGFPLNPTISATVLTICIMTAFAGLVIRLPFVIAPGMGLNAMIIYTFAIHQKLSIPITLGVIFWSSIILIIFSVTNLRQKVIDAIPEVIQIALSVGIGLFLIMVGLKNAQIIVSNPNTLLVINKLNLSSILCLLGFIFAAILFIKHKTYSMLLPIIVITILSIIFHITTLPSNILTMPDFSLFAQVDIWHSLSLSVLPSILSLFLVMFFDATSSAIGLLTQINHDCNDLKKIYYKKSLFSDGLGSVVSSILGSSPTAIFVESSVAIHNGARTGLASIVTALLCVPFLFLSPLISIIPPIATSPILMLVGMLMANNYKKLHIHAFEDFIAVVLTAIMIPLCFSITAGAVFGIISYTILKILLGKTKEINVGLIIVAICCSFWFVIY